MKKFDVYTREEFFKNFPKIPKTKIKCTFHTSASPRDRGDTAVDIDRWHRTHPTSPFREIGYHFVILPNGDIQIGRSLNLVGAHVGGNNKGNIGICHVGGFKGVDDRTSEQKTTQAWFITFLIKKAGFEEKDFKGHNDFTKSKSCPNYNVKEFIDKHIGNYLFSN